MYFVDSGKLNAIMNDFGIHKNTTGQLLVLNKQLLAMLPLPYTPLLDKLKASSNQLQKDMTNTLQYFQNASALAIDGEYKVINASKKIRNLGEKQNVASISSLNKTSKSTKKEKIFKSDMLNFTHRYHTTFQKDRNLIGYLKNGVCIGAFAGFDALKFSANKNMKYVKVGGDIRVGSASISGDAKALLFQNGKFDPALQLEANAEATLLQGNVQGLIGNDYISAQGEASVKVGTAYAEAKAVISKDEYTMRAKVGAAAVRGEVKGTLNIFGIKITATGIGEVGAVGASADFSSKKGEFEIGTKASFIAGLGFKIHVNY